MPVLSCYVSDNTFARLRQEAGDLGRTVEDLAESAVEESVRLTQLRAPEQDALVRERCKRDGVVNIVNGTCTTCEKPQGDCWCLPF